MPISPNFSTISYVAARSVCLLGVVARCTQYRRPSLLASGFSKASVAMIPAQRRPHGSTLPSLNRKVWAAWRCASGTMAMCSRTLLSFVSLKLTGTTDVCVVKFVKNRRHYHRVIGISTIATVPQSHFRVPPNPDSHPTTRYSKTMRLNPATPENNTTTAPCKLCRTYIMSHNHQNLMRFEHVAKFIPFCQSVPYGYMQQLSYPILWWLVTCNKGASLRWIELYNVELYHNHRNLTTFENVAKFTPKCQCIPR